MNIQQAIERVSLKDLIESTGRTAASANTATGEYTYQAPYREDNDPSLKINLVKKRFIDYGQDDAKGDVVHLARLIIGNGNAYSVTVSEALQWLKKFAGDDITPIPARQIKRTPAPAREISHVGERFVFVKAVPITARTHKNQLTYIVQDRGISLEIASMHLEAITYKDTQALKTDVLKGIRYGIGGRNDAGGYEVRAASRDSDFKTSLGPKDITTIPGNRTADSGNIFEGRFDFLTYLQMSGQIRPSKPAIILNTGRFATRAAEVIRTHDELKNIKNWRIWQQNDDEGERTTRVLCEELGADYSITTLNHYWDGYNDLNNFWTEAPTDQRDKLAALLSGTSQQQAKFYDSSATADHRRFQDQQRDNKFNKPKL